MIGKQFEIEGGNKLFGTIENQTSKNAVLPILSATFLLQGETQLFKCPNILDFHNMIKILKKLGAEVENNGRTYTINTQNATNLGIDFSLSKTMRSSIFLLGSLLARFKQIMITTPGGCEIGKRPIDMHIKAFQNLGVKVETIGDYIFFDATRAHSGKVQLKFPSVGATENVVQFASLLDGKTVIKNAAREPEVVDLCNFLKSCGAKIEGAGTRKITIYGVSNLKGCTYVPMADRIVAGTIMIATALTGGDVTILDACVKDNLKLIKILRSIGCQIEEKSDTIHIVRTANLKRMNRVSTGVHPKFPTDLQSLVLVLSCLCKGQTRICERIFENRFLIVPDLKKMGANIVKENNSRVSTFGVSSLLPTQVRAKDLRGGAGLVLAGLVAHGITTVENVELIDRGYEQFEEMLNSIGAKIKRK